MRNLHEFNCQAFEWLNTSPEVLQAIEAVTGSRFQTGYIDKAWEWIETDGGGFNDSVRESNCPAYYELVNSHLTSEVTEWLLQNGTELNSDRMLLNSDGDVLLWSNTVLIAFQDKTLVKICEALGWQYRPQEAVLAEVKKLKETYDKTIYSLSMLDVEDVCEQNSWELVIRDGFDLANYLACKISFDWFGTIEDHLNALKSAGRLELRDIENLKRGK